MVKTRHSGDLDESLETAFMSLHPRKARGRPHYAPQMNGYDTDESGEVELGPSRRTLRKQAVPLEETTDDEESNTEEDERDEEESEEEEEGDEDEDNESNNNGKRRPSRISFKNLARAGKNPVRKSLRKHDAPGSPVRNNAATESDMNGDCSSGGTRRSNRQRKLTYGSLYEKHIDRHHTLTQRSGGASASPGSPRRGRSSGRKSSGSSPARKRRLTEADKLRREAGEEIDAYGRSTRRRSRLQREIYGTGADKGGSESELRGGRRRPYSLRVNKPTTSRYEAPIHEPRRLTRGVGVFRDNTPPPPPSRSRKAKTSYDSPARRRTGSFRRRKTKISTLEERRRKAFHGDSDSTSSSGSATGGDSSDDERRFQRRKAKSMAKARGRLLPMNFTDGDVNASGVLRDRSRAGASMADIDPMDLDRSVTFTSVGGLGKHLRKLKEMIVFPLLYPEVFDRFKISPPRGVLFYGPPGTGKTLVARALANECSTGDRKVAFFMRKGADCLSKWVGESERQLRLLFDQAYQMRPSVIFFDEIDGLAPVRSSKQDQIHSSLVSTLLALMDGLDNRGEVVVIGATNRIDSIDPALRRPGRFDREFLFPLPTLEARAQILQIHTREWNPKIRQNFMEELATKTVGYCGADLKSLCTEAALHALRRRYPQIYLTNDKLQLDVTTIEVSAKDFSRAMDGIVPTAQRSASAPGRALTLSVRPLLGAVVTRALTTLMESFPAIQLAQKASLDVPDDTSGAVDLEDYSDDDENAPCIFEATARNGRQKKRNTSGDDAPQTFLASNTAGHGPSTHRPRMLVSGHPGQGQSSHVAPALLHAMEKLPVHVLDLPALYAVSVKTAEESCADVFREARRTSPSIVYMPHIGEWWDVISDTVRSTFTSLLRDVEASMPLLLLATSDVTHAHLPAEVKQLFNPTSGEVITMQNPSDAQRRDYFTDVLLSQTKKPPPCAKQAVVIDAVTGSARKVHFAQKALEVLPRAPTPEPRALTAQELARLNAQEEATMRELRLFLRDILNKLGRDRKFQIFAKPVDEEEVPDYYEIITEPMDLSTMMSKIDLHQYQTVKAFLQDIDIICRNALEYNPDKDPQSRAIRHRACSLKDTALALLAAELDPEFEKLCEDIAESRQKRGQNPSSTVPDYYFTKPLDRPSLKPLENCLPDTMRKRGAQNSENNDTTDYSAMNGNDDGTPRIRQIQKRILIPRTNAKSRDPFIRHAAKRRRYRYVTVFVNEHGKEVPDPNAPVETAQDSENNGDTNSSVGDESNEAEEAQTTTRRSRSSPRGAAAKSSSSPGRSPTGRKSSRGGSRSNSPPVRSPVRSPARKSPGRSPRARSNSPEKSSPSTRSRSESPAAAPGSPTPGSSTRSPRSKLTCTDAPLEENTNETDANKNPTVTEPRLNRTARTRQKANELLEAAAAAPVTVTIDQVALRRLLDVTVQQTHNLNVEKLEKLHSRFAQCVYRHRHEGDKAQLLKDMENTLERFCSSHW